MDDEADVGGRRVPAQLDTASLDDIRTGGREDLRGADWLVNHLPGRSGGG